MGSIGLPLRDRSGWGASAITALLFQLNKTRDPSQSLLHRQMLMNSGAFPTLATIVEVMLARLDVSLNAQDVWMHATHLKGTVFSQEE